MATCGSCKAEGQSVEHVRECYQQSRQLVATVEVTGFAKQYVESRDFRPMALTVPDSKYALEFNGQLRFYEIRTGKGKWAHMQFVDHLVGSPSEWNKYPVKGESKKKILGLIAENPTEAAVRYGKNFTRCAVCSSPLSDPESIAAGIGPICAKRF